jgi:hypothetical protein
MPKEEIDPESIKPYKNSAAQNLQAHKQIQKKVWDTGMKLNKEKMEKIGDDLFKKNTYFNNSKIPDNNQMDLINSELEALSNIRQKSELNEGYCQKCPALKNKCAHKTVKENLKDKYTYPVTTSSSYGWLKPYDNLDADKKLTSQIQNFYDKSHL